MHILMNVFDHKKVEIYFSSICLDDQTMCTKDIVRFVAPYDLECIYTSYDVAMTQTEMCRHDIKIRKGAVVILQFDHPVITFGPEPISHDSLKGTK